MQSSNEINEKVLFDAKFEFPILLHIVYILLLGALIISAIISTSQIPFSYALLFLIPPVIIAIIYYLHYSAITMSACTITTKRIYGTKYFLFLEKKYSYRIDAIDAFSTSSILGIYSAKITFAPATGSLLFRRSYVRLIFLANYENLYYALSKKLVC